MNKIELLVEKDYKACNGVLVKTGLLICEVYFLDTFSKKRMSIIVHNVYTKDDAEMAVLDFKSGDADIRHVSILGFNE